MAVTTAYLPARHQGWLYESLRHLKAAHNGYENVTNPNGTLQPAITEFLKLDKSDSLDKWAWIVTKALPISFCEDPHPRACTKLPRVSRSTLKNHLFAIMQNVTAFIREHLPHAFGLGFDGWTTAGIPYIGLLAVFPATSAIPAGRVLLAFSPLEDESDLSAQILSDFIADTLSEFERRGCLVKVTGAHPKFKNETRWSSTMTMLKMCHKLIPCLRQMDTKDAAKCGTYKLMLTASEAMGVSELLKDLVKLDSVTVALQSESLTMSAVRDLFDHSISKYPVMKKYLSSNASIVSNPVFERALVKLQSGRKLTPTEKAASTKLLASAIEETTGKDESGDEEESQISFAQQALKRRRLTGTSEVYIDTAFIPPTSKLIFTDHRRAMKPATLERLVFLRANCTLR
ncbi:hypothetical protein Pcac1_g3045 [Phytophthora cactorum]|nr:hypothetical protein Pcac1_g3045 [Phytophthora cactorum]KAG3079667.1 hypothetical protein PC122_g12113 [Phytophthora cactorum]KAG3195928.1 hypothetical protein PC128_g8043 [Phytophthora cactorum]